MKAAVCLLLFLLAACAGTEQETAVDEPSAPAVGSTRAANDNPRTGPPERFLKYSDWNDHAIARVRVIQHERTIVRTGIITYVNVSVVTVRVEVIANGPMTHGKLSVAIQGETIELMWRPEHGVLERAPGFVEGSIVWLVLEKPGRGRPLIIDAEIVETPQ